MNTTEHQAAAFRDDAEKFREKIQRAMQESHVDTWTADRMIYVVDYLDTLLQGFFAFQNVLWDRFGKNGDLLAQHVGNVLEMRLKYVQQTAEKAAENSQKKVDDWVDAQKSLPDEVRKAVNDLPGVWAKERIQEALEQALPDALQDFHARIRNHPAALDALIPVWDAQLTHALQDWLPKAAQTGLQHLQEDADLRADLEKIGQAQARAVLEKMDYAGPWQRAIQELLDSESVAGRKQAKAIRESLAPQMTELFQKTLANVTESALEQHLVDGLRSALNRTVEDAMPDLLGQSIEPALGNVIRAYFLKNPLDRSWVDSMDKLHRKLIRTEERLDAMQQAESERGDQIRSQIATLTESVQGLYAEVAASERRIMAVIRQMLEGGEATA